MLWESCWAYWGQMFASKSVYVSVFLQLHSFCARFHWGLVLYLLIAVSGKLICRCYKYAWFIYFIYFFSLEASPLYWALCICLFGACICYATILIVTLQVKPLNYVGLFLCFGQVHLCSPRGGPCFKVLFLVTGRKTRRVQERAHFLSLLARRLCIHKQKP